MKKQIRVTLFTSEILHDVENNAYLTGKAKRTADNAENVALIQASEDPEDSDKIMRSIGSAYNTLFGVMSDYISDDTQMTDNTLWDRKQDLVINLVMPSNFNPAAADTITSSAHDYTYNLALADWLNVTDKADAKEYYAAASAAIVQLKDALSKRLRPQRVPLNAGKNTFFGVVPSSFQVSAVNVTQLTSTRLLTREYRIRVRLENNKVCYAYPKAWGMLDSVKDNKQVELISQFGSQEIVIDGEKYLCYMLQKPMTMSDVTLTFQ